MEICQEKIFHIYPSPKVDDAMRGSLCHHLPYFQMSDKCKLQKRNGENLIYKYICISHYEYRTFAYEHLQINYNIITNYAIKASALIYNIITLTTQSQGNGGLNNLQISCDYIWKIICKFNLIAHVLNRIELLNMQLYSHCNICRFAITMSL